MTAAQLQALVRAYADEHFPGWRRIEVRVCLGEPGGQNELGELVLVLLMPPDAPGPDLRLQGGQTGGE